MRFSGRLLQKLKLQCNHHAIKTGRKEHNTPKLSKYLQLYTEYKFSIHALLNISDFRNKCKCCSTRQNN